MYYSMVNITVNFYLRRKTFIINQSIEKKLTEVDWIEIGTHMHLQEAFLK